MRDSVDLAVHSEVGRGVPQGTRLKTYLISFLEAFTKTVLRGSTRTRTPVEVNDLLVKSRAVHRPTSKQSRALHSLCFYLFSHFF